MGFSWAWFSLKRLGGVESRRGFLKKLGAGTAAAAAAATVGAEALGSVIEIAKPGSTPPEPEVPAQPIIKEIPTGQPSALDSADRTHKLINHNAAASKIAEEGFLLNPSILVFDHVAGKIKISQMRVSAKSGIHHFYRDDTSIRTYISTTCMDPVSVYIFDPGSSRAGVVLDISGWASRDAPPPRVCVSGQAPVRSVESDSVQPQFIPTHGFLIR